MKNTFVGILLIILLMYFCGCASITYADLTQDNSIKVYMYEHPKNKFEELCYIEAFGSIGASKKVLLKNLQKKAKEKGCNAIMELKFGNVINVYPVATCIGIKE